MSEAQAEPAVVSHPPRPVDIPAIERALTQLWKPPGPSEPARAAVTRACMSNLLIYCSSEDQAAEVTSELDVIVRVHPSRVLLLVGDTGAATTEIEAYVSAHCHLAGDRHQVCSEQVTVSASGDAVQRLPSTARSLLVGDLPTSLWWTDPTAPPLGGELFDELKKMADQVIYSSFTWPDPLRGTLATSAWIVEGGPGEPVIADLAWRRLEPWRSLIGQALDPAALPGALETINRVEIEHGPHGLSQAWLLAGWLASRLEWHAAGCTIRRGRAVDWKFHSAHGIVEVYLRRLEEGDPLVRGVTIGWKGADQPASMTIATAAPGRLCASIQGASGEPRGLAVPVRSRAMLVATQLQDLERDSVFKDAARVAREMAEALAS